jgi:ParB family chromosome partitioning protein
MELEFQQLDRRYERLRRQSPERERRLLASLAERGQQAPIIAVAVDGAHVVVDGFKRVRALQKLRRDVVEATQWELPEADALILERQMRASDEEDVLEQAWLLCELRDRFELSEEKLACRFDKSRSWVSRRLGLCTELPEQIQEQVRRGELGAHSAMKYLLPLARANRADCLQLVAALSGKKPSCRQLGELYKALLTGSAETRELVLKNPWLFLRALQEAQAAKAKERTPAQMVLGDLALIGKIARQLYARLNEQAGLTLSEDEKLQARGLFRSAAIETQVLFRKCEQLFPDTAI